MLRFPHYEEISESNLFCKYYDTEKCVDCEHRLFNRCVKLTELGFKNK